MKKLTLSLAAGIGLFASTVRAAPQSSTIQGSGGPIRVTAIFHASTQIEYMGRVIDIDPVSAGRYTKKADIILVTHTHPDHFDPAAIDKVRAPFARLVAPIQVIVLFSVSFRQSGFGGSDCGCAKTNRSCIGVGVV